MGEFPELPTDETTRNLHAPFKTLPSQGAAPTSEQRDPPDCKASASGGPSRKCLNQHTFADRGPGAVGKDLPLDGKRRSSPRRHPSRLAPTESDAVVKAPGRSRDGCSRTRSRRAPMRPSPRGPVAGERSLRPIPSRPERASILLYIRQLQIRPFVPARLHRAEAHRRVLRVGTARPIPMGRRSEPAAAQRSRRTSIRSALDRRFVRAGASLLPVPRLGLQTREGCPPGRDCAAPASRSQARSQRAARSPRGWRALRAGLDARRGDPLVGPESPPHPSRTHPTRPDHSDLLP